MAKSVGIRDVLELSLRATSLRGRAIANNIANVNTPGFERSAVRFESLLAKAISSGDLNDSVGVAPELFAPKNTPMGADGNDVDMEMEMGELIKNGTSRKVYLRVLKKLYQQMNRAIGAE